MGNPDNESSLPSDVQEIINDIRELNNSKSTHPGAHEAVAKRIQERLDDLEEYFLEEVQSEQGPPFSGWLFDVLGKIGWELVLEILKSSIFLSLSFRETFYFFDDIFLTWSINQRFA